MARSESGVFHKACQAAIIAYIIWQLASDRAWVITNTPSSTVNAWASRGDSYSMYEQANYDQAFPKQCDDPADFYYSKDFVYNSPVCLYVVPEQLVTKGVSSVSLVTFFLSKKIQGEPCGTQAAIDLKAACAGPDGGWTSGVWTEMDNGQCECTRSQSVYPVGVDQMLVSFEHTCARSPRRYARARRACAPDGPRVVDLMSGIHAAQVFLPRQHRQREGLDGRVDDLRP